MTTKKSSVAKATSARKVGEVKAAKTSEKMLLVPAASSSSAYNYYANNDKARSEAVARFYGSAKHVRRKAAK